MSIQIRLPGEIQPSTAFDSSLSTYSDQIKCEVLQETNVNLSRSRGRDQGVLIDAEPDDVLELVWEDGIIELIRADELKARYAQTNRDTGAPLTIPTRKSVGDSNRSLSDISLEALKHIRIQFLEHLTGQATEQFTYQVVQHIEHK